MDLPRTAVVLAHGRGDHCFPYGGQGALRPKYAMEVVDVPLVRRVIDALLGCGMERVVVATGFRADAVEAVVAAAARPEVRAIRVGAWREGDAPALAEILSVTGHDGPLVIVAGDLLVEAEDIRRACATWAAAPQPSIALMVDELPPEEDAASWVGVDLDGERVAAIRGRREVTTVRLTGLAVVPAEALPHLRAIERGREERRYLHATWGALAAEGLPLVATRAAGPVVHVDRCFDYLEANAVVRDRTLRGIATARGVYAYVGGDGEPDPRFIFPGTIIAPGARLVFEEGSFIGPYDTWEANQRAIRGTIGTGVLDIRIRGNIHLGRGFRIGLNALIEGDLVTGAEGYVEDSVVEPNVVLGDRVRVRRGAVVRQGSVCGAGSRFECAADFAGVAGPGTVYMHPGQCQIVTGRNCDLGAGNWCGTWRFDSGVARFLIGGRLVRPRHAWLGNTAYLGDEVRTGIMVCFAPGTRVGADTLIGMGVAASRDLEPGTYYRLRQDVEALPVAQVRPRRVP